MSTEHSSTREEESSGQESRFKSKQRKMLHLLLERDTSFTICSDLPRSADSANLSILSGGTPKRCLDLSNLSGEMSATQLTTSSDLDETGREKEGLLHSSGPLEVQLAGMNHHQDLMKGNIAQLLCSTPNALDHDLRKKDLICSLSTNKENNNGILENEMKYLGSPITAVSKLDKNPKLEDNMIEGISRELTDFSLKDEEDIKVQCRSLRGEDRALNQYPALYYPELYILKGGYRDFFPEYMELCEPQSYCPMHHQDHQAELLRCQSQSKAQEGERQLREQIALLVKDVNP
ncbi:PREDICTED: M-phase inducer phosphatase 3 [Dipodomys ordii]|uniref:M-phase inducer phosphatase 3 n=1 Tax=Dipodomys ordii TaxID=10020 RepID=A0A1S3FGY9_DIPOR|nr:PREDICTED: M-phase inducer phosphatase 3 [Dipodomys ordii]